MNSPAENCESGYDDLARAYRWFELVMFQKRLWRARIALVDSIKTNLPRSPRVLVLGDGDGRLLSHLCTSLPTATFTSVEKSEKMLRLQQERTASHKTRVKLIHADATKLAASDFEIDASYDLLVSAFFLDCFSEQTLNRCLPVWLQSMKPGGLFYWVDFMQPKAGWQYYRAKIYLTIMHVFFRCTTDLANKQLVDIDGVLSQQPLHCVADSRSDHGLISSRLYRLV